MNIKQNQKITVYLAGKITGDTAYRAKFCEAKELLEEHGYIVLSPAVLPAEGFSWSQYMNMGSAMLAECDQVCFLPDWRDSRGALCEYGQASALGKVVFFFDEWKRRTVSGHDDVPKAQTPSPMRESGLKRRWIQQSMAGLSLQEALMERLGIR